MQQTYPQTWQARNNWHDIFRAINEKNMQPRILYPARLSLKIEGEKKASKTTKTKRICKQQTGSTGNIERSPLSKERT